MQEKPRNRIEVFKNGPECYHVAVIRINENDSVVLLRSAQSAIDHATTLSTINGFPVYVDI